MEYSIVDWDDSPNVDKPNLITEPDHPDRVIWRYTSVAKLINVIRLGEEVKDKNIGKLVLARSDLFEDEYEGTVSFPAISMVQYTEEEDDLTMSDKFKKAVDDKAREMRERMGEVKELHRRAFYHILDEWEREARENIKKESYLNCWRADDVESSNMWRAYTTKSDGVAIKSTFRKLCNSIRNWDGAIYISPVNYIDYHEKTMRGDAIAPFFHKRSQFKDESEIRVLCTTHSYGRSSLAQIDPHTQVGDQPPTLEVEVDLTNLLDEVVVHPDSREYLKKTVENILDKYDIQCKISTSSLAQPHPRGL